MKAAVNSLRETIRFIILTGILLAVSGISAKQYPSIETYYGIQEGTKDAFVAVEGDIKASRKQVWEVLTTTDKNKICTHTKDVLEFSIHKISEGRYQAYYLLDYPWPFQDKWQKLEIVHDKSHYKIFWNRIAGSIKRNRGYYVLEEHDAYTTLSYRVEFDPGIKYIPEKLVQYAIKVQAPRIVKNIRKCVDHSSDS
ncbi:MAG: hypothetical protein OEZ34_07690 [Spirochaetia bacterium]|nr:hypothetical protein [Spirochaetia bacterium]